MKRAAKKPRETLASYSHLEEKLLPRLLVFCKSLRLPDPHRCYLPFKGTNELEFDFCWPAHRIAIEVQGGIDKSGRRSGHVSRGGIRRDYYKCNLAQTSGWILLQFPPEYCTCALDSQVGIRLLRKAFKLRGVYV